LLTVETIVQSLASGLLMGLLYGLIAVGLALIFGLMDVTNFAHGEFLMIAMYASFFLFSYFAIDPLLSAPLVAAALFVFGAIVYLLIVRFAMRAKANDFWPRHRHARTGPTVLHARLSQHSAVLDRR
jgi:branched-chain amino acid transport system permease protein